MEIDSLVDDDLDSQNSHPQIYLTLLLLCSDFVELLTKTVTTLLTLVKYLSHDFSQSIAFQDLIFHDQFYAIVLSIELHFANDLWTFDQFINEASESFIIFQFEPCSFPPFQSVDSIIAIF